MEEDSANQLMLPPFVRDSPTSRAAAIQAYHGAPTQRTAVLRCLREHPAGMTDEEIQARLVMNPSTQRPRRVELVQMGLVRDSGRKRPTSSGRSAVVWEPIA